MGYVVGYGVGFSDGIFFFFFFWLSFGVGLSFFMVFMAHVCILFSFFISTLNLGVLRIYTYLYTSWDVYKVISYLLRS